LEIRIIDKKTKTFRDYKTGVGSEQFSIYYEVSPTKKGEFSFQPYELPKEYSWTILKVHGYPN
jgi:hypothetical protein